MKSTMKELVSDPSTAKERIKTCRKEHGWTQTELVNHSGVSINSIKSYESGRRIPEGANLQLLAKTFQVSPLYLLGESPVKNTWEEYDSLHEEDVKRIRTELQFIESAEALGFVSVSGSDDPEQEISNFIEYVKQYKRNDN